MPGHGAAEGGRARRRWAGEAGEGGWVRRARVSGPSSPRPPTLGCSVAWHPGTLAPVFQNYSAVRGVAARPHRYSLHAQLIRYYRVIYTVLLYIDTILLINTIYKGVNKENTISNIVSIYSNTVYITL